MSSDCSRQFFEKLARYLFSIRLDTAHDFLSIAQWRALCEKVEGFD